jgi:hypothetical protein
VEEYNRVLRVVNNEVYSVYAEGFEDGIENIDTMGGFKVINEPRTLAISGAFLLGSIPDD